MNNSKKYFTAYAIWVVASVFYAYQYVLRVMPNIMMEDICQQFQIGASLFGQFSGLYYLGYAVMHLPIGILLDRVGPKKVMTGSILLAVLGLLPLLYTTHWLYPIVGRALIGMGSSAAILGVFKIIRMTFSETRFPRMLSISVMIGLIGAIWGGGPVNYLREIWGFHEVVKIFIFAGLILALLTFFIAPNLEEKRKGSLISDIKEVLTNSRVLLSCLFAGFMVGPLEGFADVWGCAYLKQVSGMEETLAASLPSMIFVGMCFGSPILSFIAEKTNNFLLTIVGAGAVMTAAFFALLLTKMNVETMSFSFILVGICCSYQILSIYKASTYVRSEVAGLTTALANMIIMTFGYGFHTVIGYAVDSFGGTSSAEAMRIGVAVIPAALMIGLIGYLYLISRERKKELFVLD